jgi:hypothetical protein
MFSRHYLSDLSSSSSAIFSTASSRFEYSRDVDDDGDGETGSQKRRLSNEADAKTAQCMVSGSSDGIIQNLRCAGALKTEDRDTGDSRCPPKLWTSAPFLAVIILELHSARPASEDDSHLAEPKVTRSG